MRKKRTLAEYIAFCRKHGFIKEAKFYETEVPKVLFGLGLQKEEVLQLSTEEVIEKLYFLKDFVENQLKKMGEMINV